MFWAGAHWFIGIEQGFQKIGLLIEPKLSAGYGNEFISKAEYEKVSDGLDYFQLIRELLMEGGVELPTTTTIFVDLCDTYDAGDLTWSKLNEKLCNVKAAYEAELQSIVFLGISEKAKYFQEPTYGWNPVIERFDCLSDVEEARKCIALNRSTGAVFHLMRIVERGILELEIFLKETDAKAHFGSVLSKLENAGKNGFANAPDFLKPHFQFVIDILPYLHATKDAWRDKVSHVGNNIIPSKPFTEEMAIEIHNATLSLMKKLAIGLPKR
jgi:hypothetical protein